MKRSLGSLVARAAMLFFACLSPAHESPAQESPAAASSPAPSPEAALAPVRRALVVCGLPGDEDHRKLFAQTIESLYSALTARHGFAAEHVAVLFGGETNEQDGPALKASRGPATRERLTETAADFERSIGPGDALWVFVFGHAHFDGRLSWLNLPGPDMNQVEFGKLFGSLRCREQAFFMTTPASGYFIKPLSARGRVVIAATEADFEVNETIFPHKLVKLLAEPPALAEFDIDGDQRATLFDAYLGAARDTAQEYATGELLATEHALLDDDGDGRGTEAQADYLPVELGGRLRAGRDKPTPRGGDGAVCRGIALAVPLEAPASAKDEPAETANRE